MYFSPLFCSLGVFSLISLSHEESAESANKYVWRVSLWVESERQTPPSEVFLPFFRVEYMKVRKVSIVVLVLTLFIIPVIIPPAHSSINTSTTYATAYVGETSISSEPFILDVANLPWLNPQGSNIRFFEYSNLTGQLYAYEQLFSKTTWTVNTVESTGWETLPYWQNGQLVFNCPSAPHGGQYIAWRYTPSSNTFNVTIHITSWPSGINNPYSPGIAIYSPTVGDQPTDIGTSGFLALLVTFNGQIWYHETNGNWVELSVVYPTPSTAYPFTFTVTFTENSAGNVTVSTVYINSTAYTVNVNTPFPWSQIGYVGIRGDIDNLFYVSYFAVSPSPFVNSVESTDWKTLPYWQNGELVINGTGASAGGQYIAWRFTPSSNTFNVTIHITSWPSGISGGTYPGIEIFSPNVGNQPYAQASGFLALLVTFNGNIWYHGISGISGCDLLKSSAYPTPSTAYPFTFTVTFTENSAGNVTVSTVYINSTAHTVNLNTPFPWSQIGYIGITSCYDLFYVSYFAVSPSPFVNSVESTGWETLPYWQNGQLVFNCPSAPHGGQYIGWRYTPVGNIINATIHITSFSSGSQYSPGIAIYSPTVGDQPTDIGTSGFLALLVTFNGQIWYHETNGNWVELSVVYPTPSTAYPFTFTVTFTENSAGNVTVSTVYINSTAYTVNVNTPFPWSQIGYIGITSCYDLFYVSYFAVSPSPFVNSVESTDWKTLPYWQNGQLVFNVTGASGSQYIAWRYTPVGNTINVTIHITSFPSGIPSGDNPGIEIFSPNVGDQPYDEVSGFLSLLVAFNGNIWYHGLNGFVLLKSSAFPTPSTAYPFTFTVTFTENSAGNVTVSTVYINSTAYTVNVNTPFPWSQIGYIGIRGDPSNLFYVSYFSTTQQLYAYELVTNPYTNTPYTGTVYMAIFPYPISYDVYVSQAPIVYSQATLPLVTVSSPSQVTTQYPIISTSTYMVIPSIGAYSGNTPLFLYPQMAVSEGIVPVIPMVESTSWKTLPYWQNGQLVLDVAAACSSQYVAWRYTPSSNTMNVTIHITSYPSGIQYNPGISIYSPNIGDQPYDYASGFLALLVTFSGNIWYHGTNANWVELRSSAYPTPSTAYPFTFTVTFTENSAGNVTISTVYINSTAYTLNVNTPFPWSQIGYVAIRVDTQNLFYVSYFSISQGSSPFVLVSPSYAQGFVGSQYAYPYFMNTTTVLVNNTAVPKGLSVFSGYMPGANTVFSTFLYMNTTPQSPVLVLMPAPYVSFNALSNGFSITADAQILSLYGYPATYTNPSFTYTPPGIIGMSGTNTFTFKGAQTQLSASTTPPSSTTPTPPSSSSSSSSSSSISTSPNTIQVVLNGSVYVHVPLLFHPALSTPNGSVLFSTSVNSTGVYISSYVTSAITTPLNVTIEYTNGTVIKSFTIEPGQTFQVPLVNGDENVIISYGNHTVTIPISANNVNVLSLRNAISAVLPPIYALPLFLLFAGSFFISLAVRSVPKFAGMGSIIYIFFVAPFLIVIGIPTSVVYGTVVGALIIIIIGLWASRSQD
ncbi:hypothetical protein [Acidianus two-tailed phage variant 1]|uniref:Uncharacterized protein n=1 Tax=Acidianus two-tailed phage variant 1 TaxID=1898550 RepID=A0A1C9EGC8_ATV|nr:hypothetical protein [Acidianus two-tailed phage variant 1]